MLLGLVLPRTLTHDGPGVLVWVPLDGVLSLTPAPVGLLGAGWVDCSSALGIWKCQQN